MALGKLELVNKIAESMGQKSKEAEKFLNSFIEAVEQELKGGNEVNITGFGKFYVSKRAARTGINPKTGEKLQIPEKKVPSFHAGLKLKESIV